PKLEAPRHGRENAGQGAPAQAWGLSAPRVHRLGATGLCPEVGAGSRDPALVPCREIPGPVARYSLVIEELQTETSTLATAIDANLGNSRRQGKHDARDENGDQQSGASEGVARTHGAVRPAVS